jgi:glycosyltransferase involved in cell wall biosynthesis
VLRRLQREAHQHSVLVVNEYRLPRRWLAMALLGLLPRAGRRSVIDRGGRERSLSWASFVTGELPFALRRAWLSHRVRRAAVKGAAALRRAGAPRSIRPTRVAFIRADLGPALTGGGSLAHIRGVIGCFECSDRPVRLLTPAPVSGCDEARTRLVPPDPRFNLSVELPHLAYNETLEEPAVELFREERIDLVYQRHALGCFAGAAAAQRAGLPLVTEFNGSEVWIARNWGAARSHLDLFAEIERQSLLAADLIVAVSEPLVEQLREIGIPEERVLVNPNGVDASRFDPASLAGERAAVREKLGALESELVAGFVWTFGPWHGAEILAEAVGRLPDEVAGKMRFLFIGDGPRRPHTAEILRKAGAEDRTIFTGMVGFDETPGLLAACDLCISPHVPNSDGTRFFGSPTKLFEYMACGRAIVASRLGQIGEVLRHDENAWLVPPGDPEALATAIEKLFRDRELRERLAESALSEARERHSWDAHVGRILDRLAGEDSR